MTKLVRSGGKFYTPAIVAKRLAALVSAEPEHVLDLCSGPGSLTFAALERWKPRSIVTIDDDPAVGPSFGNQRGLMHQHVVADALRLQHDRLGLSGTFDLVLTNPPFGHQKRCDHLFAVVDRIIAGRATRSVSAEMAALAQALWFLKPGGIVASIMPDTLVAGARATWFRQQIEEVADLMVVQPLPRNTFPCTEAKAHLVVLSKHRSLEERSYKYRHTHTAASFSDWKDRSTTASPGGQTLADLGVQVIRGAASATKARAERCALFHTDGFATAVENGVVELGGRNPYPSTVEAMPGDILMARVDRRIEDKVALVTHGTLSISDCVYRVRCPRPVTERVWRWLRSPAGRAGLSDAVRGVAARHLPKRELLNLLVS